MPYNTLTKGTLFALLLLCLQWPLSTALGQTGVSDDRVSVPDGPGSLEGLGENVGVNAQMGQSSHAIPIPMPTGYTNMTPSVSLSYSSGAGAGVAGMGWSMAVPSIERMTSRGLPEYDRDDMFAAGGSEQLVRISGGDSAVYRARFEGGFVRYTWHRRGDGSEGYWVAEYPDGKRGFFGANSRGEPVPTARVSGERGTFRYLLVDEVDVWGHRIHYTHRFFGTTSLLTRISYVFMGERPRFEAVFEYEDRPDFISDAKPGFAEVIEQRLSSIRVLSGGVGLQRYALSYEMDPQGSGLSQLVRVERFGVQGDLFPAVSEFEYARSLGGLCRDEGCQRPFLVSMGNIGTNPQSGNVTLVDINGDALPDVLDTTDTGAHRFYLNTFRSDEDHTLVRAEDSTLGQGVGHDLSAGNVQVLDVDGDGFADLLNTVSGQVLENKGAGDWTRRFGLFENSDELPNFESDLDPNDGDLMSIRFVDIDNDKRIDVIKSLGNGAQNITQVFLNNGGGFSALVGIEALEVGFDSDRLQLADMNGDGLLDAALLQNGALRYWLNLGWGQWQEMPTIDNLPFNETEMGQVSLVDINSDALSDLVLVRSGVVRYLLGSNSTGFGDEVVVDSSTLGFALPDRLAETTVLEADMNGNGSADIVWIDPNGNTTYLELFPVQPNLMSRVSNSLGAVTEMTYSTSVQQAALAEAEGTPWSHKVPYPSNVLSRIDSHDTHSNVHEITEYRYRDGFHDGVEKQFRGYGIVQSERLADASTQQGFSHQEYDLGIDDPYRAGLLLFESLVGGGEPIRDVRFTHEDCALSGLPANETLDFPIRYVCSVRDEMVLKEGAVPSEWVTTRVERTFDGYGNIATETHRGTVAIGGEGCAPCQRPDGVFGEPCGELCVGDESTIETDYVQPSEGSPWILNALMRERRFGRADSGVFSETRIHYDGPDFTGLPLGQLTHGSPTRIVQRVDEGQSIEALRIRKDRHGNMVESIRPEGGLDITDDLRTHQTFDDLGLRVVQMAVLLTDDDGAPYQLRQEATYEPLWLRVVEATDWMVVKDGQVRSPRNSEAVLYDQFGRVSEVYYPGDTNGQPSERVRYEEGNPRSRVILEQRSVKNGAFDRQLVRCFDGKGRLYQERRRLEEGVWLVNGFTIYNPNGQMRRSHSHYTGTSDQCDAAPPEGGSYQDLTYDAVGRVLTDSYHSGGQRRVRRADYGPSWVLNFNHSDTDPDSPHFDTPTRIEFDGLGRNVRHLRLSTPTDAQIHTFTYDELGHYRGHTDPEGHEKIQTYDNLGRLIQIDDPDRGTVSRRYDDAGQLIEETDGRGATIAYLNDTMGRMRASWDVDAPEETRIEYRFDVPVECPRDRCTLPAGKLVEVEYPLEDGARGKDWYGYNPSGLVVAQTRHLLGRRFDFGWDYDNLNQMLARHYPDGRSVSMTRDEGGRLLGIPGVIDAIRYNRDMFVDGIEMANGAFETLDYDALFRVENHGVLAADGTDVMDLSYTYDASGNPLSIVDGTEATGRPSMGAEYTYDAFDRLTSAHLDLGREGFEERLTWRYDALGNIASKTSHLGLESPHHLGDFVYGAEAGPHAVTAAGEQTYSYDGAGQMTRRGQMAFDWDAFGRMTRASNSDGEVVRNVYGAGESREFKITQKGRDWFLAEDYVIQDGIASIYVESDSVQTARLDSTAMATTVLSDVAPLGNPDGQITATDAWIAHRASTGDLVLPDGVEADPVSHLLGAATARLLTELSPTTFLHTDHRGSVVATTDADGALIEHIAQTPHGQDRAGRATSERRGHNGKARDVETGLVYFGARFLDPQLGRWISPDPLFVEHTAPNFDHLEEEVGAYVAMGNNPARYRDPNGRFVEWVVRGGGALFGAVVGAADAFYSIKRDDKTTNTRTSQKTLGGWTALGALTGAAFGFSEPFKGNLVHLVDFGLSYAIDRLALSRLFKGRSLVTARKVTRSVTTAGVSIGVTLAVAAVFATPLAPLAIIGTASFAVLKIGYFLGSHSKTTGEHAAQRKTKNAQKSAAGVSETDLITEHGSVQLTESMLDIIGAESGPSDNTLKKKKKKGFFKRRNAKTKPKKASAK